MVLEKFSLREQSEKDRVLEVGYIELITRRIDARYKKPITFKKVDNRGNYDEVIDESVILGIELINEAKSRNITDPDIIDSLNKLEASLTSAISHFYSFSGATNGKLLKKFMDGQEILGEKASINILKILGITRARVKVALSVGATALSALTAGAAVSATLGPKLADDAVEKSKAKLAIAFYVDDPDLDGKPIGYIYGSATGSKDGNLNGSDKAIAIKYEQLEKNGKLEVWYKALVALEDKGHEDGISSYIGINERFPYAIGKYAFFKTLSVVGAHDEPKKEGGSSIADQACGAMRSELADYRNIGSVRKKLEETLCGVGLAITKEPKEIAAMYGTYAQMGTSAKGLIYFIWTYWGFDDIDDPRFTKAHQLVLAAMVNQTWACKHTKEPEKCDDDYWEERLSSIKARAATALEILVKQGDGVIKPEETDSILKEIRKINFPNPKVIDKEKIKPKKGYDSAIKQAIKEAEKAYGPDWRSIVSSMTLSVDPNVQTVVYKTSLEALNNIKDPKSGAYDPGVVSVVAVVNSEGEIVGIHYGNREGPVYTDLFSKQFQPGSMGKILLAAAVSNNGYKAPQENPYNNSFYTHLSKSQPEVVGDSKRMKVKSDDVEDLINCYGSSREDQDQVHSAAFGLFNTSPRQYINVLWDAYAGYQSPAPHIVRSFTVDGEVVYLHNLPNPTFEAESEERQKCASLMYSDHATWKWLKAPLDSNGTTEGTLSLLNGIADAGKTGTDGPSGEKGQNNRMAWTIAAKLFDARETNKDIPGTANDPAAFYTVIAGFGSTDAHIVAGLGTGSEVAAPVVKDVLEAVKVRFESNALQIAPPNMYEND